jgi:hypothetical protein
LWWLLWAAGSSGEIVEKALEAEEGGANAVTTRVDPPEDAGGATATHKHVRSLIADDPGRRKREERRENKDRKKKEKKEREKRASPVFVKDEFGRDVEVTRERKKKAKKSKREEKERRGRASPSPHSALVGTPPPADPYRPQVDRRRSAPLKIMSL